jgi:phage terminase small subunit
MVGVKGRGGRPPKTLAEHHLDGSFRKDRHQHLLEQSKQEPAQIPRPTNLDARAAAVWDAVLEHLPAGAVGQADIPLLIESLEWFATYREAMTALQSDITNSKARTAATASWDRFFGIIQQFGVTPASRQRLQAVSAPVEPLHPGEEHCQQLEKNGSKDLADQMRLCGYDHQRWVLWKHGVVDDDGNRIPLEQRLAAEYDEAVRNNWAGRIKVLEARSDFDEYKHLTTAVDPSGESSNACGISEPA